MVFLEFLKYELLQGNDYKYHIEHTSQKYDVNVDINIIRTTTWLLQNFSKENVQKVKRLRVSKLAFNLALFDKLKVEDIFKVQVTLK